jgi:hypothetical protein
MAQCKYCEKKGFLLRVNKNTGLCDWCNHTVLISIDNILRVLDESIELIKTSKNFKTRINRIDVALDNCNTLLIQYWSKGLRLFNDPNQLINELNLVRSEIIEDEISNKVENYLEKANHTKTVRSKITNAEKALYDLHLFKKDYDYTNLEMEQSIKSFIHKVQFDEFILNAEKNEFKGNTKKALDQYQEALFFLKKDDIPLEDQSEIINRLENKVNSLLVK